MIDQLTANLARTQQMSAANKQADPVELEARLGLPKDSVKANADLDRLYMQMQALWADNPEMTGIEVIQMIRKFVAEDGSKPFLNMATHTGALTGLMRLLREDGGEASPIYAQMKKGLGFAAVSNGIQTSFIIKMLERPEQPEQW